jgi:ABC-2 type transport system permease protein
MRLARLAFGLLAISLQRALTYRAEVVFQGLVTATGVAAGAAAIEILFSHVHALGDWTLPETIALLGAFTLMTGLLQTVVEPNLAFFGGKLLSGQLDDALLQPAPSLFLACFATTQPWAFSQVLLGAIVLTVGLVHVPGSLDPIDLLAAAALLLGGAIIVWSYRVVVAAIAFWAPGLDATVLFDGLWQMGRYPVSIYRQPLRSALTYVIPVAFVSSIPVRVATHGLSLGLALESGAAVCISVLLVTLVWTFGIRHYTGATA